MVGLDHLSGNRGGKTSSIVHKQREHLLLEGEFTDSTLCGSPACESRRRAGFTRLQYKSRADKIPPFNSLRAKTLMQSRTSITMTVAVFKTCSSAPDAALPKW